MVPGSVDSKQFVFTMYVLNNLQLLIFPLLITGLLWTLKNDPDPIQQQSERA